MKRLVGTYFLIFNFYCAGAQTVPDSIIKKIDGLFSQWNNQQSPGCVIGIIRNDSLIFAKGYGVANLEYSIPNSPQTIYHMASVSKEFTAYAVLMLAKAGKLSLEDDIRKYLSWFPDLKEKITIRQLLNHTSGVRDQWQLLATSGTRLDDVITQDQIIKLLSRQQALNSKPGEKYNYSNSGFTMLAEIVKSVSGKTIREFTDSAIFKPLGMSSTHFHDDYREIEKNRAYSYERFGIGRYRNSVLSYSNAGATSLFTTMEDLSKWVMNFYQYKISEPKDIQQLTEKGKLNNGFELNYALGIVVNEYKGWRQYSHGGADAGYRTNLSVFPDLKMGFLIFSNLGDFPTNKIYDVASLFMKDNSVKKETPKIDSSLANVVDSPTVRKFTGKYISYDGNTASLEIRDGKLMYYSNNSPKLLLRDGNGGYTIASQPGNKASMEIKGRDTLFDVITPQEIFHLKKYRDIPKTDENLMKYTGTYYCPELETSYTIFLKNHELYLGNIKYNDSFLKLTGEDHLDTNFWWMGHLMMLRDSKGVINGFEVNAGRIEHLRFNKVK